MTNLKHQRWRGPTPSHLDEIGRRLYFRACDIAARLWLIDAVELTFSAGEFDGCATLLHAEHYLTDRLGYELAPWPKGMMKIETEEDYRLPETRP